MAIQRRQLSTLDFSDVASGEMLNAVSPGDILRRDFMEPLGLSANALAKELKVPTNRVTGIINGTRALTADTALRLERYFGLSASAWLSLQKNFELRKAKQVFGAQINKEVSRRKIA